jgi:hypothetical protein
MTWKRGFAIALCGCALWLYAERTAQAQGVPPNDDQPPRAHHQQDAPPGPPHDRRDADPLDDDFAPRGPTPGEASGPPGPPQGDRRGPPGPRLDGRQPGPGMQAPPQNQPPGMMPGGMPPMQGVPGNGYGPPPQHGSLAEMPQAGYGPMMGMMRRQDPDLVKEAELDRKIQELCGAYRNSPADSREVVAAGPVPPSREELKKQIDKLVTELFDLRQERRQKELKRFEEQIKRLRDTIEKREKAKADIIERHVKELLGQDDDTRF